MEEKIMYCLSIPCDEDTEYKHLWFNSKIEAEIVQSALGSLVSKSKIFNDIYSKGELIISVVNR